MYSISYIANSKKLYQIEGKVINEFGYTIEEYTSSLKYFLKKNK